MARRIQPSATREPASGQDAAQRRLVARAAEGDRRAQQELLAAHIERIRRRVVRLVGSHDDVDDLVQTACVEVLRSLSSFRGEASFELWVDRVAAHVVYKFFRTNKRHRRKLQAVADAAPEPGGNKGDQARKLASRRAAAQARALIDELNADRRMMFLLVAVEGHTIGEAAAMLDIGQAAAKSRFLRARREVDKKIRKHPELAELLGHVEEGGHE